ncbi:unnamed protein product, partial [marine sediment metagenome]
MSYMWKPKNRTAFTLIELLVVVAIIALLVAILIPALSEAKYLAMRVACTANMHHLAVACMLYVGDNNGYVPPNQNEFYSRHPWPYATDAFLDSLGGKFIGGNGHVLLMTYLSSGTEMDGTSGVTPGTEEAIKGMWDLFRCPG